MGSMATEAELVMFALDVKPVRLAVKFRTIGNRAEAIMMIITAPNISPIRPVPKCPESLYSYGLT